MVILLIHLSDLILISLFQSKNIQLIFYTRQCQKFEWTDEKAKA